MVRLHTENQLPRMPGSALHFCVVVVVVVESEFSDRLWLSFSLALAKLNNISFLLKTSFWLGREGVV
jgi:hypothetical protein